jgi:hypothetical protein
MRFAFTRISRNRKTGPIPVVTASKDTCPDTCPLKGAGCYAEHGPLAIHWVNVDHQGLSIDELCRRIRRLPRNQLWRCGQAGDLPPGMDNVEKLARANGRRPVICYTHQRNFETIRRAVELGFHINVSADSLEEADAFVRQGLSTVVVLPSEYGRRRRKGEWAESLPTYRRRTSSLPRRSTTGTPVAICPASYLDVSCAECGACSGPRRNNTIIGFPAHGSRRAFIDDQLARS